MAASGMQLFTWRAALLVALGGVLGAALDLFYACIFYGTLGVSPTRILQSIASGLLGAASYAGGAGTAALGFVLHFLIVVVVATVFYAVGRASTWVRAHWFFAGVSYGVGLYGFMNFVVVPLSTYPHRQSYSWPALVSGLLVHALLVGLPIAASVHRALTGPGATPRYSNARTSD